MKRFGLFAFAAVTQILISCQKPPEHVVEKFYRSLEAGEISVAKGCLSKQIVSQLGGTKLTAALTEESEKITSCEGIDEIKISLTGSGEIRTGSVTVKYVGQCPHDNNEKISLIREDGEWKINMSK
jgi:hypothetical protein